MRTALLFLTLQAMGFPAVAEFTVQVIDGDGLRIESNADNLFPRGC